MSKVKKGEPAPAELTMRAFRAAPAKTLRRAAREGTKLRIGEFILTVEEARPEQAPRSFHGLMAETGRVIGDPQLLLSADDTWSTDE